MYFKHITTIALILGLSISISAQENRSFDGSGNNMSNPEMGQAGTTLNRLMSNGYGDGISTPGGQDRPNPRVLSNQLFAQDVAINDGMGLSDFLWTFGQFIDHDVVAVIGNPAEPAMIPVNFDDPHFNPGGAIPNVMIPMFRNMPAPGTGTDVSNPRSHLNQISHWLDGSNIYGSSQERADWLRSYTDGKLKTSTGNLLPWNTTTGEKADPIDTNSPHMDDDVGMASRLFVAGDSRANEQPLLVATHTVFVREHNRMCDILVGEHPEWSDEELFQEARRWTVGMYQAIVFEEWLPAMGVHLPNYAGYDNTKDGSISNIFSAAAFRLGHTLLNSTIQRVDADGNVIPDGNLTLAQAFFNPDVVEEVGLDPYFKGMAEQIEQALDCKLVDDVRNFLFGPPGAGGLDLAAININRGRERGLPDLNTLRTDLGLPVFNNFSDINTDSETTDALEAAYSDINKIDAWVGMLSEEPMANALFGPSIMEIMVQQFQALRDADRFYYQNDPAFSVYDKMIIQNTTFKDIIMRNTDITLMQENVFLAEPHDDICNASSSTGVVDGIVKNIDGDLLSEVTFTSLDKDLAPIESITTDTDGAFAFQPLNTCNYYKVQGERNTDDFRNGVSNLDLIKIARQIIGLDPLASPIQRAAGDVDGDFELTIFDLIEIQRLNLFYTSEFPNEVPSWRVVPTDLINSGLPAFPFYSHPTQSIGMLEGDASFDWTAFKMGDFTQDALVDLDGDAQNRDLPIAMDILNKSFEEGEKVVFEIPVELIHTLLGIQLSVDFDSNVLEFDGISDMNGLMSKVENNSVALNWFQAELTEDGAIEIVFSAKKPGKLSENIELNESLLNNTVVDAGFNEKEFLLNFQDNPIASTDLMVYQNVPNPFNETTSLNWFQANDGPTTVEIFAANGSILYKNELNYNKGLNKFEIQSSDLNQGGLLYYRISNNKEAVTQRMIALR